MKIPELKGGQMITIVYALGVLIALFVVYKILAKVGLIKTPAKKRIERKKEEATEELRGLEYFNPDLVMSLPANVDSIGKKSEEYAQTLRRAIRGFGTNEEEIFTVFSSLRNRYNISEIARSYRINYKSDLLTDLLNDLNEDERLILLEIINKI